MEDAANQAGTSSGSLDPVTINAILRKWTKAIEENDNVFRLTGATEKKKRLEKFRESALNNNSEGKFDQKLVRPWNHILNAIYID